jgi:hypothetical protein
MGVIIGLDWKYQCPWCHQTCQSFHIRCDRGHPTPKRPWVPCEVFHGRMAELSRLSTIPFDHETSRLRHIVRSGSSGLTSQSAKRG